ncbi:ead/Ea22-like family protein [Escherichia coli]|uniref:ead/Ea22-like family protein n=1 Tax=Escherichia coli TaxID=562 RepID=UPI002350940F|nr:ead/Ea22-like family protein [Escherichia coli]MDC7917721.1 ead/Ea22-like family protein [Escherichia coli]
MKQMSLIEMDGFLKGKCIPRDLKVNETNAEYLVRKFAEAEAKISALAEDHQKAIESIKQADSAVKLAHEKFSALAAENAGLNKFIAQSCYVFDGEQDEISDAYICATDGGMPQTPATDAFLAEVRAQGVEMFAQKCNSKSEQSFAADIRDNWKLLGEHATDFAAQLRKGGNK